MKTQLLDKYPIHWITLCSAKLNLNIKEMESGCKKGRLLTEIGWHVNEDGSGSETEINGRDKFEYL